MKPHPVVSLLGLAVFGAFSGCVSTEETGSATAHLGDASRFASADSDKSSGLSKQEVAQYHHQEMLAQYDLDRDNHLSAAEWASAHPSAAQQDAHFNQVDRDGDKKVSSSEAVTWVTEHVEFTDSFKKYDLDGDSALHWKELEESSPADLRVTVFSLPFG